MMEAPAPRGGERLHRGERVGDQQAVEAGLGNAGRRDRSDRAVGARLGQEVVRVETLALERDEQVAHAQRARVGVHALERARAVADEHRPGHQRGGFGEREHLVHATHPLFARPASASSTSENGSRTPLISW